MRRSFNLDKWTSTSLRPVVYHSTFLHTTLRSGGPSSLFVWEAPAEFCAPPKKKERKRTPDSRFSGHKRSCRVEPSSNALPVTIITNWIGKYEASLKSLHLHYMLSLRSTLKKLQVLVYLLLSVTECNHMNSSLSPYNDWGIKSEIHRKYELIVN